MYYININVTCKGNTALDAATVVVLCTCQHSSRPWIRMRLVVLHVDGLRCAKVDYRIIVRLIPKNVCIAWRLRWFLAGARLTRYPEYRSLLHTSWSYCLVAVLNRTQQNNPAQSRMPGRNSPFINDRDEFYTTDEAVRARFAMVNFLTYVVLAHPLGQSAMRHDKFN